MLANSSNRELNTEKPQDGLVILLIGLAHGISHYFHMILAPLFPWLKESFQLSYAELGLLMSAFFVVSGVGQACAGFVVDRVGARSVLLFGVACLALSALVLSIAPNYTILMLGSILAGLGNSVFHPADYSILNQQVRPHRLSHAFSVHGVSGNLGWAAAPVCLVSITQASDWRMALLVSGIFPLLILALLWYYRDHLQCARSTTTSSKPESHAVSTFSFMKLPAVWLCFLFFFLISMGIGGVQSFSVTALRDLIGMPLAWATAAYTAYMLSSACGMIWGGFISAKTQHHDKTIFWAFSFSAAMALVLATGIANTVVAFILMASIGLGAGIAGPSRDLLIRAATPKQATGRVYGLVYSGLDIGLAISPTLFGAMMDAHHPAWVFLGIALFQLCAIATATGVGVRHRRGVSSEA